MKLTLLGPVPSKKNLLKRGRGSHLYRDKDIVQQIADLEHQAKEQWDGSPWAHPDITVTFYVTSKRSDRDNKLTTILDVLQSVGILFNDNIKHSNGTIIIHPAVSLTSKTKDSEKTMIELT